MLHLEHVGQAEGVGRGGDEREEQREYGEGRDVEPDQVDDADVRRLDASIQQHAHLVGARLRVRVRVRARVRVRVRVRVRFRVRVRGRGLPPVAHVYGVTHTLTLTLTLTH